MNDREAREPSCVRMMPRLLPKVVRQPDDPVTQGSYRPSPYRAQSSNREAEAAVETLTLHPRAMARTDAAPM
ncbi:hypothetical protein [Sphingomonas sp.]|uniref:hypothetical protein n=1 Tax=Sphingomonas sp. TaxID=28214 RepID=UPI003B00DFA8